MKRLLILREKIRILFQVLRINLRTSVITLIGLSIALSTITSCLIYLETNKADYYLSLLEQDDVKDHVTYDHWSENIHSFEKPDIVSLQEALDKKISERGLEKILVKHPLYPTCYSTNRIDFLNQSDWNTFYGINLNESILEDCVEGSYFPTTMNETILLTSSILDLKIGDPFTISFRRDDKEYYSHTLQIAGLITPGTLRNTSLLHDIFPSFYTYTSFPTSIVIITDLGKFSELFGNIDTKIRSLTNNYRLSFNLRFRFDVQISYINQNNVIKIISTLISFLRETNHFYLNGIDLNELSSPSKLIHGVEEFNKLFFYFLILCVPAFLLTILLGRFSLGLISERRKKSLTLFRMRGVSPKFLFSALLLETLVISLIAALLSIILGIFGFFLISTTTGYLTFNLEYIPATPVFPYLLVPLIVIFSVGFTCLTPLRPMIRLIKSELPLLDQESIVTKKSKPRKFIGNIDTFLLIQGLLGILVLIFILNLITGSKLDIEEPQLFTLFLPLILLLLVLSPFSFLIGFIFAYNRFIPSLTHKISNYCWKRDWGLVATASRNLAVDSKITGQVTLLIACTLSFLMILSSLPISFYHHSIDSIYYRTGADIWISVSLDPADIEAIQELKIQLNSIEGLNITTISTAGFDVYDNNGIVQTFFFFGIEENFHQVAHWRSYYDDQPLHELVHSLFNSSESYPIIIDSTTAQKERLTVKNIYRPFISEPDVVKFSVEGVSDYWPRFIVTRESTYHYLITKRDLIENISVAAHNSNDVIGYYTTSVDRIGCKVLPGYDPDTVTSHILNVTENDAVYGVEIARSRIENEFQSLPAQFLWVIANFNFLNSLIVVLIVLVLFTFMRISSHATEIGLSRALGMKYKQVFLLMFIEPLILFLLSGIPGSLVGLLLLTFFTALFSPLLIPAPPFILDFNIPALVFVYALIFGATVLTGVITSLMATRANISKILKVE